MVENYRTTNPRTPRVLTMWIKSERLAFDRKPSLAVEELLTLLPTERVGDISPSDESFKVFRKISYNFNNVSEVWIGLMRFIGIPDFSIEQAILGSLAVALDNENVRVGLHQTGDDSNRKNTIEVFCLDEPDYQGFIKYEADRLRLSIPPSIFSAFVNRHLSLYQKSCSYLSQILVIPAVETEEETAIETEEDIRKSKPKAFDLLGVGEEVEKVEEDEEFEEEEEKDDEGEYEGFEGDGLEF